MTTVASPSRVSPVGSSSCIVRFRPCHAHRRAAAGAEGAHQHAGLVSAAERKQQRVGETLIIL